MALTTIAYSEEAQAKALPYLRRAFAVEALAEKRDMVSPGSSGIEIRALDAAVSAFSHKFGTYGDIPRLMRDTFANNRDGLSSLRDKNEASLKAEIDRINMTLANG